MAEKIETGGPAFPTGDMVERDEKGMLHGYPISSAGMTLRDYYAAHALNGLLAADQECGFKPDVAAEYAYRFADAMVDARGGDRD